MKVNQTLSPHPFLYPTIAIASSDVSRRAPRRAARPSSSSERRWASRVKRCAPTTGTGSERRGSARAGALDLCQHSFGSQRRG
eukprot:3033287-Pleurochrysis_carterae.AAC.4